jgi:hypothetical protein
MAAGFPTKDNFVAGDVLTATNMNDLGGTVNLVSPTAKGSIKAGTAAATFGDLAIGANATVLTADSAEATGMKWAAAGAGGGMTLINTTTASSSATITVSSIPSTYKMLLIRYSLTPSVDGNGTNSFSFNGDTANNYVDLYFATVAAANVAYRGVLQMYNNMDNANPVVGSILMKNYADTDLKYGVWNTVGVQYNNTALINLTYIGRNLAYRGSSAISSFTMSAVSGTFTSGTVETYGIS